MSNEAPPDVIEADRIVREIMAKTSSGDEWKHLPIAVLTMLSTNYAATKLRDGGTPDQVQYIIVNSADVGFCMARDVYLAMKSSG